MFSNQTKWHIVELHKGADGRNTAESRQPFQLQRRAFLEVHPLGLFLPTPYSPSSQDHTRKLDIETYFFHVTFILGQNDYKPVQTLWKHIVIVQRVDSVDNSGRSRCRGFRQSQNQSQLYCQFCQIYSRGLTPSQMLVKMKINNVNTSVPAHA